MRYRQMDAATLALLVSAFACGAIVFLRPYHQRHSIDAISTFPQKVHTRAVPRIGGLGILAGVAAGAFMLGNQEAQWIFLLLLAALPAFAIGTVEDLTKVVSHYTRLFFSFGAAAIGYLLLDARITDLDLPWDDLFFRYEIVGFGFTLFAVGGFAHATNIIDGMNGLAGLVGMAILAGIAAVAWQVGDERIFSVALIVMGATTGFLVWNFPRGALFLGDGGAYFLGFAIATLAVLLVHRNSEVSPWFALLVLWYPTWETLYSMYRRKVLRGRSAMDPDGLHLHTLVYRRIVKLHARPTARSAVTTLIMLALNVFTVVPAVLFWDETWILQAYAAGFVLVYLWIYMRIVRFGLPLGQILGRKSRKASLQGSPRHPGGTL